MMAGIQSLLPKRRFACTHVGMMHRYEGEPVNDIAGCAQSGWKDDFVCVQ